MYTCYKFREVLELKVASLAIYTCFSYLPTLFVLTHCPYLLSLLVVLTQFLLEESHICLDHTLHY